MNNETQQTAVEWIETLFYSESKQVGFDRWVILESDMDRIINKAKEMEKEQIKKAWVDGNYNTDDNGIPSKNYAASDEGYYKKNYGGNK
jgi:hypothetical protein